MSNSGARAALTLILTFSIAIAPAAAEAATATEVAEGAFDVVILRPLNLAALLLGSVFFVASVPLSAPVNGFETPWDIFVYAPYEYVFDRPLGEF